MRLSNEIRGFEKETHLRLLSLKSPIYVVFARSCLIVIENGILGIVCIYLTYRQYLPIYAMIGHTGLDECRVGTECLYPST